MHGRERVVSDPRNQGLLASGPGETARFVERLPCMHEDLGLSIHMSVRKMTGVGKGPAAKPDDLSSAPT